MILGRARPNPIAAGFTTVATVVIGAASVLGGLVGYMVARVILRGD